MTRVVPRGDPETVSGFVPDAVGRWLCQDRPAVTSTSEVHRPPLLRADRARSFGGEGRIAVGVCASVSNTLGVDPLVTRLCFVVLAVAGGWGVLIYSAAWLWFVVGAESVPPRPSLNDDGDVARDLGFAVVTLGLLLVLRDLDIGFVDALVWPVALIALGLAVAWRRVGEVPTNGWLPRAIIGAVVVLLGSIPLVGSDLTLSTWIRTLGGVAIVLAGVSVMFAPTLRALGTELVEERQRRIRSDERAVISSHLHDSVLQTLALIQKRAADPAEVAALARQQERELRSWLYAADVASTDTFRSAVLSAAADVEGLYRTPVESVVVGDLPMDGRVAAIVAAAREAAVNAAKFSGAMVIDVYAEVTPSLVELFVRDRGIGFDVEAVAPDRRGIAESIVARVERVGGVAEIRSGAGKGTEVRLRLPVDGTGS